MTKIIIAKNMEDENYENHLMSLFWRISIPSYLLAIIFALILRHVFPFMVFCFIYLCIDKSSTVNPWLKDRLNIIFKDKHARLFRVIWFIIPVIVLCNDHFG